MSTALEPVTVLRHAQIYTMDPAQPRAEALAWRGHRLIAVGSADEVTAAAGPRARLLDGDGATIIPGLIDAHIHFMWYAMGLLRVNLEGTRSVADVRERVAARVATLEPGAWVLGGGWDNTAWDPPVFPTAAGLDPVTGDHPAMLDRKDGHSIWVNHAALAAAGITRDTPDPPGGRIGRDASGAPDGMLYEGAAIDLVAERVPRESAAARDAAIDQGLQAVVASGLTTIQDVESPEAFVGFQQRAATGRLPVRVVMFLALPTLRESVAVGLRTGFGNARLRIGPVKIFSDGSLGSRTAEMLAPFEGTDDRGVATIPQADLEAAILEASAAGIAVAVHAIGDAANRRVLDAFARARAAESGAPPPADGDGYARYALRHRIEHAQLVDPADWPRFRQLGVIASMQPIHATSDMAMADRLWGARAARGAYAWQSLQAAGARLAFGSDAPVETFDPLAGIHAAVTRQRPDGTPPGGWTPDERLSVADAVRAYTLGAAYAAGEEDAKGSLTPGKLADFVVLDQDLFTIDPATIPQTRVRATVVGGEVVAGSL